MNSKVIRNRIVAVFAIGLLFLTGCKSSQVALKVASSVIRLFTVVTVSIKRVEAANLDVEAKKLEIESIKKNGEKVTIIQKLNDSQFQQIKDTGKAEIKLEDGSTVTVMVTVGSSRLAASSELKKIKNYIENSFVNFKNKNVQVSGKTSRSWIQKTSRFEESGAAARIEWNDGVISTILFLEDSRVRVWVKGVEYGGEWSWSSSGRLQVQMNQGSHYSFGS